MAAPDTSNIEIYLRMRPITEAPATYEIDEDEGRVQFHMPRQVAAGMANHQKERYDFFFTHIFDTTAMQDTIFERVARKVVLGSLDGFNGTIFAYGQTGSGKTYTITGGAERYVDRGIIPRTISLIYSELGKRSDYSYTIHFSYLEIYNETGIDLLNPDHETTPLEELPKVSLLEDDENVIHMRNLSSHLATNEEEALNLLFVGDTNRMISSTPMNMASSRSHCIFTAYIEARKAGEDIVRKSKLHLVDLAGSERVSKTGVDGQILKEAKYINLSLHFLEQVIVALQEKSQGKARHHIPYRNSMMTSVLRDALGGNCQTVMLATASIAQDQLEETISTCRFAQRVATISNKVLINEELDPSLVIRRLKQEVKDLKAEIQLLRGNNEDDHALTESEVEALKKNVHNYVNDTSFESTLNFGASVQQIRTIFSIFKDMINNGGNKNTKEEHEEGEMNPEEDTNMLNETIRDLHRKIQERDNEINILVNFIRKQNLGCLKSFEGLREELSAPTPSDDYKDITRLQMPQNTPIDDQPTPQAMSFEVFQKNHPKSKGIDENKMILRSKYNEVKELSGHVNAARDNINKIKTQIQRHRIERAMEGIMENGKSFTSGSDPLENELVNKIETEKRNYKDGFNKLRDLKREIENINNLLEQAHMKIQDDWQKWNSLVSKIDNTCTDSSTTVIPILNQCSSIDPDGRNGNPTTLVTTNSDEVGNPKCALNEGKTLNQSISSSPKDSSNSSQDYVSKPMISSQGYSRADSVNSIHRYALGERASSHLGIAAKEKAIPNLGYIPKERLMSNLGNPQREREMSNLSFSHEDSTPLLNNEQTLMTDALAKGDAKVDVHTSRSHASMVDVQSIRQAKHEASMRRSYSPLTDVPTTGNTNPESFMRRSYNSMTNVPTTGNTTPEPFMRRSYSSMRDVPTTGNTNVEAHTSRSYSSMAGAPTKQNMKVEPYSTLMVDENAMAQPFSNRSHTSMVDVPTTGNAKTDADIAAFYKARDNLLKMKSSLSK
uniref:Kinesin 9B protein n=1 Tax=Marsilea vestita TaxID=59764 RepID=A0A142KWB3_MARVE|nr:kinesin 9B protein [Marsilea vestita]